MTDIVERLLDTSKFETWEDLTGLIVEAADEIERLRADVKNLQRLIRDLADVVDHVLK
jgi:hypothetical protein